MERDFKGVWIPKDIFESCIGLPDKLYLSIYLENKDIQETEKILSFTYSNTTIFNTRNRLITEGKIHIIESPEEARDYVISKKWKGEICEWCGNKSYILHEHHFPISKSQGGSQTVRICPNCHCAFHAVYKQEFLSLYDGDYLE